IASFAIGLPSSHDLTGAVSAMPQTAPDYWVEAFSKANQIQFAKIMVPVEGNRGMQTYVGSGPARTVAASRLRWRAHRFGPRRIQRSRQAGHCRHLSQLRRRLCCLEGESSADRR